MKRYENISVTDAHIIFTNAYNYTVKYFVTKKKITKI